MAMAFTSCRTAYQPISIEEPPRPKGQTHVVGLVAPKIDTVRIGIIGLGMRGISAVERFIHIPGVEIKALCDIRGELCQRAEQTLTNAGKEKPTSYYGDEKLWKKVCERDDIDLIYVVTDWENHANIGVYAMQQGKHVAIEVPAAMTLDEIWALVNTSEQTRKHCIQLENCVYDFFEMTTLNMAQQGVFGELLHVEGSYIHYLEEFWPYYYNNWRLNYNNEHRGDVYPTHGIGPACQLLDIHRGDRMKTLVSMDTKSINGKKFAKKYGVENKETEFQNADHTLTLIQTENGKTLHLQHNVMTPRPYSRMYQLTGTAGFANKYPIEQYCFQPTGIDTTLIPDHENLNAHQAVSEEIKAKLMQKYKHPIHIELETIAKQVGGHGGMDFIMDWRLIYCLQNGLPLDMDVYDLAEWCSVIELSRLSIENGNMPVAIPDFTRGYWNLQKGYKHAFAK
ncbi:MAG: Gfo/Idh/MocA family oxidoreductase [Bacteroidales bacterium]|nr:Gfo/Idh/MocA family oxidoreductase [Bacteroidales bacterium]